MASTRNKPRRDGGADPPPPDDLGPALLSSHLALAMALITEPWCNTILRAAFLGVRRFDAFQQVLQAPRQTLSLRLAYLVDVGLLHKQPQQTATARHEYRLTAAGKSLYASILASWAWDRRWSGSGPQPIPLRLQHRLCGHAFRPQLLCEHCQQPLSLGRMRPVLMAPPRATGARERNSRWRGTAAEPSGPAQRDILAVIDDRWSMLLVAALMLGARRFDELTRWLGISSAVLTRRLQRLCAMDVIRREPDPQDARRSIYLLDRAGRALFAHVLVLARWGGTQTRRRDSLGWIHRDCGQVALGRMACSHCRETLLPREVVRPATAPG